MAADGQRCGSLGFVEGEDGFACFGSQKAYKTTIEYNNINDEYVNMW